MSRAAYPLKLPQSIKEAARRLAREDGVSLNQWSMVAVAEKVGAIDTAADFLRRRAGDLLTFLRDAPDAPPDVGDRIDG